MSKTYLSKPGKEPDGVRLVNYTRIKENVYVPQPKPPVIEAKPEPHYENIPNMDAPGPDAVGVIEEDDYIRPLPMVATDEQYEEFLDDVIIIDNDVDDDSVVSDDDYETLQEESDCVAEHVSFDQGKAPRRYRPDLC